DRPCTGRRGRSLGARRTSPDREDAEDRPGPQVHQDRAAAAAAADVRAEDRPVEGHHAGHHDRGRVLAVAATALQDRQEPRGARRCERRPRRGAREHRPPLRAGRRPPAYRGPRRRDVRRQQGRVEHLPREPQAEGQRHRSVERPGVHPGSMESSRTRAGRDRRLLAGGRNARVTAVVLVFGSPAATGGPAGRLTRWRRPRLRRRRVDVLRVAARPQRGCRDLDRAGDRRGGDAPRPHPRHAHAFALDAGLAGRVRRGRRRSDPAPRRRSDPYLCLVRPSASNGDWRHGHGTDPPGRDRRPPARMVAWRDARRAQSHPEEPGRRRRAEPGRWRFVRDGGRRRGREPAFGRPRAEDHQRGPDPPRGRPGRVAGLSPRRSDRRGPSRAPGCPVSQPVIESGSGPPRQRSLPRPPASSSLPRSPFTSSSLPPPLSLSFPPPPFTVSAPSPPVSVSPPAPPSSVSPPSPPLTWSLPEPPITTSLASPPETKSAPEPPSSVSSPAPLLSVSLPLPPL